MLDKIRSHPRLMYSILLILIFPPFLMFGLEGFARMNEGAQNVATVNGQPITKEMFDAALRNRLDEMRNRLGNANVNLALFNTPELRKALLEQMIQEQLQLAYQKQAYLTTSDQQILEWLKAQPQFRGPDGKFDPQRYKQLVATRGMGEAAFEARLRAGLASQIVPLAVSDSEFLPTTVVHSIYQTLAEKRVVRELTLAATDFAPQVKVAAQAVTEYYEKNQDEFKLSEQADIEYLVLDESAISNLLSVSEAELAAFYEQNKNNYATPEQRRASHILIQVAESATAAEKSAALRKAKDVLAQVRQQPAKFAELAARYSDDPGSKTQGGDLNFFGRHAMVPAFDAAVFSMQEGQISDLIETKYGFHIIKLTAIKPAHTPALAEVREELQAEVRKQLARRKFAEYVDQLNDLIFKNPENLSAVAQSMKLNVQKLQGLTRQAPSESKLAVYQPKFLQAIFAEESLQSKKLTEAIEVGNNALVVGRVLSYRPSSVRPLAEVEALIRKKLATQAMQRLAEEAGQARLKALQAKTAQAELNFSTAKTVSREQSEGLEMAALRSIFQAPSKDLPQYVGMSVANGYRIYKIEAVLAAASAANAVEQEASKTKQAQLSAQLTQAFGESALQNLLQAWQQSAKIKINEKMLAQSLEQ